jgi:ectoine hydroxylase-related dioxygenase (phytanoyl-CoA dioxygenase family)
MSAMRDTGSPDPRELRAAFEARGWIVLRGVVPAPDLIELNRAFDGLIGPVDGGRGVVQRPRASDADPAILRHLHAGAAAIAGALLGARSVQLLQDALLLKPPARGAGSIALHQDYSYTGYLDPPSGLAVGLALTNATHESGCLHVVDGSHAWGLVGGLRLFAPGLESDLDARLTPAQRARVADATIPLEVQAGDVTIHHCLTLHGSGANTSGRPRKAIIAHLVDGDSRVVGDRLPAEARLRFPIDADGRLSAAMFPTLWRREADPAPAAACRAVAR